MRRRGFLSLMYVCSRCLPSVASLLPKSSQHVHSHTSHKKAGSSWITSSGARPRSFKPHFLLSIHEPRIGGIVNMALRVWSSHRESSSLLIALGLTGGGHVQEHFDRWHKFAGTLPATETLEGIAKGTTGTSKNDQNSPRRCIQRSNETPNLHRYLRITSQYFKELLGKESAIIDGVTKDATDDIELSIANWMRKYRGHTKLILKPGSTDDVSKILSIAMIICWQLCHKEEILDLWRVGPSLR